MDRNIELEKIRLLKLLIKGLEEFESMWIQAVSTLEEPEVIRLDKAA